MWAGGDQLWGEHCGYQWMEYRYGAPAPQGQTWSLEVV